ncbi:MAG: D-alanyl-D-alanine carboxypeptidase/D-alanyl-D-alanine-endopeptidase [Bacteroidota bacterium]
MLQASFTNPENPGNKYMRHYTGLISFFGTCLYCIILPAALSAQDISIAELQKRVEVLASSPNLIHGQLGYSLRNLSTGRQVIDVNAGKLLTPASTLKTITTGAALGLLGPEYKFSTYLEYDGKTDKDGTLNGNLYIRGTGDPSLCSERFPDRPDLKQLLDRWSKAVSDAGIKKINGAVIADADAFDENMAAPGWAWSDIGNYFGAPVSGLNVCDNFYKVIFKAGKAKEFAAVKTIDPEIPGLELNNYVKYSAPHSGDNAYIYGAPYSWHRIMSGTLPASPNGYSIKGAMPDPALFLARRLSDKLRTAGLEITADPITTRIRRRDFGKVTDSLSRTVIDAYQSPPLSDLVAKTNIFSLNLYAESLLKTIGKKKLGDATTQAGIDAVSDFWKSRGIERDELMMTDGSGLSPTNAVTPAAMSQVFFLMSRDKASDAFSNSLAIAGQSGTLKDLCIGTPAAGNLRGKSGTLTRVLCYAGYFTDRKGEKYCFALMVNRYSGGFSQMKDSISRILSGMGYLHTQ